LLALAKTFDDPPIAVLPPGWYATTQVTLDMGGVIPAADIGGHSKRRYEYEKEKSFDWGGRPRFGWENFYIIDPGRKLKPATAGGWAHGLGDYVLAPSTESIRKLELAAIGDLNARPHWLEDYSFAADGKRLALAQSLPWQPNSWRKKGKVTGYDVKGSGIGARPRDDAHGWYYHMREAYYATANPWIRDWYVFIGEFRKNHFAKSLNHSSRALAHSLSQGVDAYRITGDKTILAAAHRHVNRQLRAEQDKRFGFRNSLCCGKFGEAAFQAGYLARAVINLMEEVEPTSQVYADAFQLLSGLMHWNLKFANFSYYVAASKGEIGKSDNTSLTFVDPQSWYFWRTGRSAFRRHVDAYVTRGLKGGAKPAGRHQFRRWTGAFQGRWYRYAKVTEKADRKPPPPVMDLKAVIEDGAVLLSFKKPTDAVRYHVVWGDKPISAELTTDGDKLNWWAANALPSVSKQRSETIEMPSGARYAALFSFDIHHNMSAMSNLVEIAARK
jgi:hypothetical protein